MKGIKRAAVTVLFAGLGFTEVSSASLFDRGGGMIYDSDQNITWLADANLFKTQLSGNTNLVNDIIAANNGVIHDTPNAFDGYTGTYNLTDLDFHTYNGKMTWWGAQAWANSLVYGGFDDWRLPTTNPAELGYNNTGSEMGHLFYTDMGSTADQSITNTANYNLFSNVQFYVYWSGPERTGDPKAAWDFFTTSGPINGFGYKGVQLYAWAVRSGDVASIPVPAAIWLFTSGLGLLSFANRRKDQGNAL